MQRKESPSVTEIRTVSCRLVPFKTPGKRGGSIRAMVLAAEPDKEFNPGNNMVKAGKILP